MGVCSVTSKCILLAINVLFWACAAFFVFAGVSYLSSGANVLDHVDSKPAAVILGAAGVLFLCGLIGIAATFSEKKMLLAIFSFVIVTTLCLLIFVTVTAYQSQDKAWNDTETFVKQQFHDYKYSGKKVMHFRSARSVDLTDDSTTAEIPTTTFSTSTSSKTTTTGTTTITTSTSTKSATTEPVIKTTTAASNTTSDETTTAPHTTAATTAVVPVTTTAVVPVTTTAVVPVTTTAVVPVTTTAVVPVTTTAVVPVTTTAPDVDPVKFIDEIQKTLKCCGYDNYTDWNSFPNWGKYKGYVPKSCCNITATNGSCPTLIPMKRSGWIYQKACGDEIKTIFDAAFNLLKYSAVILTILIFFGFCATMILMFRKKNDEFSYSSIVA